MSDVKALNKQTTLYARIALLNFFAAACLGLTLRFAFVYEIPWIKYKNVMHAHSHVAMLGWIYLILTVLLWRAFGQDAGGKSFSILFWLTEISVLGMLFSFPFQGYGAVSISFSALFMVLSYVFAYKIWKGLPTRRGHDILLLKTSLIWMVISTIGVWAMGPIMANGAKTSSLYYMAIQFFLHFQFNGWFTFAVLALFFNQLREANIAYPAKTFRWFYILLVVSCVLTFALAITWADPEDFLFLLNSTGVVIQLVALIFFIRIMNRPVGTAIRKQLDRFTALFYRIAFLSFVCKILIQSVVVLPQVAVISYTIRLYVLGFIHLIMLGAITAFLLGNGFSTGILNYKHKLAKTGWILLIAGFILSELILFGQGTLLWAGVGYLPDYYIIIFLVSILLPAGILLSLLGQLNRNNDLIPIYNTKPFH